jgi:hypothetical protein
MRKRTYSEALKQEVRIWARKPLAEIEKLDSVHPTVYKCQVDGVDYQVEVQLLASPEDRIHVSIGVCPMTGFGIVGEGYGIIFWRDGRVDFGEIGLE